MKAISLSLSLFCLLTFELEGQTTVIPLDKKHEIRARIGIGFSIFTAKKRLRKHFDKNDFDNHSEGNGSYFISLPEFRNFPVLFEAGVGIKVRDNLWVDMMAGRDNLVFYENNNNHVTVSRSHKSWYISPQITLTNNEKKPFLFAGPTLDYHQVTSESKDADQNKKLIRPGAIAGLQTKAGKFLTFFLAYRWTPRLHYNDHSQVKDGITYVLPGQDIGFGYLRFGFMRNISLD